MQSRVRRPLLSGFLVLQIATGIAAQDKRRDDVAPPWSDGPLLVLTTASGNGDDRHERVLVVDVESSGEARVVYEGPDAYRVRRRLDRTTILIAFDSTSPGRLDLTTGVASPLLPGVEGRLDVVDVFDGGAVVVRRKWGEAAGQLLRCVPGERAEVLHEDVPGNAARKVLDVRRDGIWYFVDSRPPEIWTALHKTGTARRVAVVPSDVDAENTSAITAAVSPDGRHVAVGIPGPPGNESGFRLFAFDTMTQAVVAELDGIPQGIGMLSSDSPRIAMAWVNDRTLRFSETVGSVVDGSFQWVDWDIRTGQRIGEHVYGPVGLSHPTPNPESLSDPREEPFTRGAFAWTTHALYLRDNQSTPIFEAGQDKSGQIGTVRVSPDGQWAVAQLRGQDSILVIDREGKRREVARGWLMRAAFHTFTTTVR